MGLLSRMTLRKTVEQVQRETQTSELKRTLGAWNLVFLGIGCIIGAGIFVRTGSAASLHAGPAVLNAWTTTNTNTNVPRAISGDPNNNSRTSDRFIEDGSYMRIKNLTIGYTIPGQLLGDLTNKTVSKVRVYVSSQNLLTLTKYTGYDPEIGSRNGTLLRNGIDYANYPQARTLLAGLQITF